MVDLSKVLAQRPQLFDRKALAIKASSRNIHHVSIGQSVAEDESYATVQVLYLGNNRIKSLRWARTFSSLVVLSLVNNHVTTFHQVSYLSACSGLRSLGLLGNPITKLPNYRANTIDRLRQISQLDSIPLMAQDRARCAVVVNEEKMAMAMLLETCCNLRMVSHVRKIFDLHDELCGLVLPYPSNAASIGESEIPIARKRSTRKLKILLNHVGYPELLSEKEISRTKQELLQTVSEEATGQLLSDGYTSKTVALDQTPASVWRKCFSSVEQKLREQLARQLGSCTRKRGQENQPIVRKLVVVYALNDRARKAIALESRTTLSKKSSKTLKQRAQQRRRRKTDDNYVVKATASSEQLLKTATPVKLNRRY